MVPNSDQVSPDCIPISPTFSPTAPESPLMSPAYLPSSPDDVLQTPVNYTRFLTAEVEQNTVHNQYTRPTMKKATADFHRIAPALEDIAAGLVDLAAVYTEIQEIVHESTAEKNKKAADYAVRSAVVHLLLPDASLASPSLLPLSPDNGPRSPVFGPMPPMCTCCSPAYLSSSGDRTEMRPMCPTRSPVQSSFLGVCWKLSGFVFRISEIGKDKSGGICRMLYECVALSPDVARVLLIVDVMLLIVFKEDVRSVEKVRG